MVRCMHPVAVFSSSALATRALATRALAAGVLVTGALLIAAAPAFAASVQGTVIDVTKRQGVDGVKVILLDRDGKTVAERITNGAGVYTFKDLKAGNYTIRLEPTGYVPNPHEIANLPVNKEPEKAPDAMLWPPKGAKEQYLSGGAYFARYAMEGPNARAAYQALWRELRPGQLSAVAKQYIVQGIQSADKDVKHKVLPFNYYLSVDPDDLLKLQNDFRLAVEGKDKIPSKDAIAGYRVSDGVLGDIVLFELNNARIHPLAAKDFVIEYKDTMKGSKSIKAIDRWYADKKGKDGFPP